jgi:hypothetical protein
MNFSRVGLAILILLAGTEWPKEDYEVHLLMAVVATAVFAWRKNE